LQDSQLILNKRITSAKLADKRKLKQKKLTVLEEDALLFSRKIKSLC